MNSEEKQADNIREGINKAATPTKMSRHGKLLFLGFLLLTLFVVMWEVS